MCHTGTKRTKRSEGDISMQLNPKPNHKLSEKGSPPAYDAAKTRHIRPEAKGVV